MSRYNTNVPDELERIVSKMLRKNPDERYQTMKGPAHRRQEIEREDQFSRRRFTGHRRQADNAETQILNQVTDKQLVLRR
jgi:hypothetical protein